MAQLTLGDYRRFLNHCHAAFFHNKKALTIQAYSAQIQKITAIISTTYEKSQIWKDDTPLPPTASAKLRALERYLICKKFLNEKKLPTN